MPHHNGVGWRFRPPAHAALCGRKQRLHCFRVIDGTQYILQLLQSRALNRHRLDLEQIIEKFRCITEFFDGDAQTMQLRWRLLRQTPAALEDSRMADGQNSCGSNPGRCAPCGIGSRLRHRQPAPQGQHRFRICICFYYCFRLRSGALAHHPANRRQARDMRQSTQLRQRFGDQHIPVTRRTQPRAERTQARRLHRQRVTQRFVKQIQRRASRRSPTRI